MSAARERGGKAPLPFGLAYSDLEELPQGEDYLKHPLPINGPMTNIEEELADQYLQFEESLRNSTFFTGDVNPTVNKNSSSGNKEVDKKNKIIYYEGGINDGLKRYSDKYRKEIKVTKSIDDHPLYPEFFPEELRYVLASKKQGNKKLQLSNYTKGQGMHGSSEMDELIRLSEEQEKQQMMDKLDNADENDEENEAEDESEEEDDEFEEDEDDDYNAEKYFDDGDDDFGNNDDGDDEAHF